MSFSGVRADRAALKNSSPADGRGALTTAVCTCDVTKFLGCVRNHALFKRDLTTAGALLTDNTTNEIDILTSDVDRTSR